MSACWAVGAYSVRFGAAMVIASGWMLQALDASHASNERWPTSGRASARSRAWINFGT